MTTVYVAGSSEELERVSYWQTVLRNEGIDVVGDWVEMVREVGEANPRGGGSAERQAHARSCLSAIEGADILWVLVPDGTPGRGAYYEAGYARALGLTVIFSGDYEQSIFGAMADYEHDDDADAVETIRHLARLGVLL